MRSTRARAALPPTMTEAELQDAVITMAHVLGYRCAHFRPAQVRNGRWATPVGADGAGFPDLVIAKPGRLIFAELKSARGVLSPAQIEWACSLRGSGALHRVWRPEHWLGDEIENVLRGEDDE